MVSTRSSSGLTPRPSKSPEASDNLVIPLPSTKTPRRARSSTPSTSLSKSSPASSSRGWSHRPSPLTLLWLAVSLPLVAWDTGYVLGRPHTMPGGSLHWPLWVPYELYGTVDYVYGWKAWNAGLGFTGAQGMLNLIETAMYAVYWGLWYWGKRQDGRVEGRKGGLGVVVGFAAAVMTLSKTVLYWLNEYYSGFDSIGHNSPSTLFWLWIIPNGLWLVFPTYMIYELGNEIVDALAGVSRPVIKTE